MHSRILKAFNFFEYELFPLSIFRNFVSRPAKLGYKEAMQEQATVKEWMQTFYQEKMFADDAETARWIYIRLGFIKIPFPNLKQRREWRSRLAVLSWDRGSTAIDG